MNERQAIESTYFDKLTIYRMDSSYKDPKTKQTKQVESIIAEDVSCALSQSKGRETKFTSTHGEVYGSYTLFCAPEVDIIAGDKIVVTNQLGQVFNLWAGKPFKYISHAEIPLSEEERT